MSEAIKGIIHNLVIVLMAGTHLGLLPWWAALHDWIWPVLFYGGALMAAISALLLVFEVGARSSRASSGNPTPP